MSDPRERIITIKISGAHALDAATWLAEQLQEQNRRVGLLETGGWDEDIEACEVEVI